MQGHILGGKIILSFPDQGKSGKDQEPNTNRLHINTLHKLSHYIVDASLDECPSPKTKDV
jgi:hypothetical protein